MEMKPTENPSIATVLSLYDAISSRAREISGLISSELEWWFHGPQNCHHMMKMLTGKSSPSDFRFEPRSIDAIEDGRVIVEGWEGAQVYWVHVWTLKDGVITQFREYFNTWLTVTDLRPLNCLSSTATLWQSHPRDVAKRSLPGLMLAI
ncbi:wound-induced protein 1 [Phtheirospermum japonicum]|uniref:Wound-induced protein 1 n=1 Tax=Phtheirospermum japonicum TaxID=374723 RepID=A0A830CYK4_9LAMI|nr:wound-induced protein 1 [Phtheirospermum japonicum]